jgi:hypothetical protein|tara:strand:- start:1325 stop:2170 length:846 start_codon:yes stop_codon:yes gene_type:complete
MALKAKKPIMKDARLKVFMYGDAGVGKTTAAFELPKPYIIDSEQGTNYYADRINEVGGAVFQTTLMSEVMDEVRSLRTEKHDYKTLVIDAITPLYFDLAERMEAKVGSDFGRHIAEANKHMRRLVNMLMELDMNVIMTAHSKVQYGDDMKKLGVTFDGWKRLDFIFDLVLELRKVTPTNRKAKVVKSRLPYFPDGEVFDWTYNALSERVNVESMEREVEAVKVATPEQIEQINKIAGNMQNGNEFVQNCIDKAKVEFLTDLSFDKAEKMITAMRKKIGASE